MAEGPAFLPELESHLLAVQDDGTKPLDSRLFSMVEAQVTGTYDTSIPAHLLRRFVHD